VQEYAFANVTSSHSIEARFAIKTYSITATSAENGSISPSGPIEVTHGNELNEEEYGHNFGTDEHETHLAATFDSDGSVRLFHVRSFDMDNPDEIGLYLNGVFLEYLEGANASYGPDSMWWLPAAQQISGENRIEFIQNGADETWGITRLGIFTLDCEFGNLQTLPNGDLSYGRVYQAVS
jgi:hypothetical protein